MQQPGETSQPHCSQQEGIFVQSFLFEIQDVSILFI